MKKYKVALWLLLSIFASGLLAYLLPAWTGAIFGLYFSLFIPGLLLLILLKKRVALEWEYFLYSMGLGVVWLIAVSLFASWLLRSLGISRPLSPLPIFLSVGFFDVLLLATGYLRWAKIPIILHKPNISKRDLTAFVVPIILLFGFVAGAIRLNNGATGSVAVTCYILSIALIIWLFITYKKIKIGFIIWALWLIALGILLSSWLRGSYVNGIDVVKEFQIFELVKHTGYWSVDLYKNAYTACLSVSLLPVSLSFFTKVPDALIFKLVIPTLYSLIIPIVFIIAKSQAKVRLAIITTLFFFAQPTFTVWWWIPIRQEVAFLFFALLIMMFVKQPKYASNKVMFFLFGLGMIVSHYSTSYVAIGLFIIFYLVQLWRRTITHKVIDMHFAQFSYLLIFLLFTFFWYSQVTTGFSNATQFFTKSFQNIDSLFSSDVQQNGQTAFSNFNIFSTAGTAPITPIQYAEQKSKQAENLYGSSNLYNVDYGLQQAPYQPADSQSSQRINLLRSILKVGGNALISLGVVFVALMAWKKRETTQLVWIQISSLILFSIALFLPFFSSSYGEDRLYLQFLVISSGALGVYCSFKSSRWGMWAHYSLLGFVVLYFLILNQVPQYFMRSAQQTLALGNNNEQYYIYNIQQSDVVAVKWLSYNSESLPVYGDYYSRFRLTTGLGLHTGNFMNGVLPDSLPRKSLVFQDASNTLTKTAFDDNQGILLYQFPESFLNYRKSVIYTNAKDVIYR